MQRHHFIYRRMAAFPVQRDRRARSAIILSIVIGLSACNRQGSAQPGPPQGQQQAQVSVVTLQPQSVAITAKLPGRVSAMLVAEVRPQVSGIIKTRLFREGSEVTEGSVLYEIDPATYQAAYQSALATQQKAEAAVPSAQAKVDRYRDLLKQNAVSKQDYDDAASTLAQAVAAVAAAQADVETARINLANTKVTAPISGRIDKSSLTPGTLVTANQTTVLTTIRQLDPIAVDVTQSSSNLLKFRSAVRDGHLKISGPNVAVRLQLDNGAPYDQAGRMEFAEANIDQTTGTFALRAEFPNPDRLLLPGMFVRAMVQEGIAEQSFLVPQRSVTRNARGEAVAKFVAADGTVEERVLQTQRTVGSNWLVDGGITGGDRIIVEGAQLVRAGQTVTPNPVTVDEASGELRPLNRQSDAAPGTAASTLAQN